MPDFEGPEVSDDEFEYEIGKDGNLVITFKGASNGDCYFETELEIDGPSDSVAFFRPQILVQNAIYPEKYTKIADATLTISTTNPDDAGEYEFTYTMEDTVNRDKETIRISVEIIAPEEPEVSFGGGSESGYGENGGEAGSNEADAGGSSNSTDTASSNSTDSADSGSGGGGSS